VLKDALKEIWYAPSVREGWQRWRAWLRHARDSDLAPLQRFTRNLRRHARGILASARFHMHTSLLEGVNNRIKVIKRMAYWRRLTFWALHTVVVPTEAVVFKYCD
jgi:transposase